MQNQLKTELSFHLEVFDGPLDLLLKLISKNKINIYDIPIAFIFEQYMEHIDKMREMDMEVAGEFIIMAAELMLIKSRTLLPKTKDDLEEEDPRAALAAALVEYKKAKDAADFLKVEYDKFGRRMIKETDEIEFDRSYVACQDIGSLIKAMDKLVLRRKLIEDSVSSEAAKNLMQIMKTRITPIHEKVVYVLRILKKYGSTDFDSLMIENRTKSDLVAAFLAILQLISSNQIKISGERDDGVPIIEINYDRKRQ